MREQEHNNEVVPLPNGFKVVPKDENRPNVVVTLDEAGFWSYGRIDEGQHHGTPLYGFYPLVNTVVEEIYKSWVSPKTGEKECPFGLMRWMKQQTARGLNSVIHREWKRCISNVDPRVEQLQKRFFSLSPQMGGYWENVKKVILENDKYLVSDILSYKAAAVSVLYDSGDFDLWENEYHRHYDWEKDWMLSFAKDNIKYTSLNKTLMNLPNNIIYSNLLNLKEGILPEPATTRLRLLAYLSIPYYGYRVRGYERFGHVIKRSTDEDIKKAIQLMWHYFPSYRDSFKAIRSIIRAFGLIYDYTEDIGKWDILGLAKRSEEYHHALDLQIRNQHEEWQKQHKEEYERLLVSKTKEPPIPLPKNENVRFLDSYVSVIEEGKVMRHCIAQYAERAVRGDSFLFHVDYKDCRASVEVSPQGYVAQSYGEADSSNVASEYGRKILSPWAKKLVEKQLVRKDHLTVFEPGIDYEF